MVLARDEEAYIGACLDSLAWADEVLVVLDDATRDATGQVARWRGARVERARFVSFSQLRNAALDLARGEWVLFVDADERVPADLATDVHAAVDQ